MTVIGTEVDREALSLAMTCEFDASPERVWQLWADPRKLERWWGPPGWPASVTAHDFSVGGRVDYHMTRTGGRDRGGWMRFTLLDAPLELRLSEGFSHDDGREDDSMPVSDVSVSIAPIDGGTRMTTVFAYSSLDDLEKVVSMGMVEGLTSAAGQIESVLAT